MNIDISVLLTDIESYSPLFINKVVKQKKDIHDAFVLLDRYSVAHEFTDDDQFLCTFGKLKPYKRCLDHGLHNL